MKLRYYLLAFLLIGFNLSCTHYRKLTPRMASILVFSDEEAMAIRPVIEYLIDHQLPLQVVALGPSAKHLGGLKVVLDVQKHCGVSNALTEPLQTNTSIASTDLEKLQACLQTTLVLTGFGSLAERQISEALQKQNRPVWAYYASLDASRISDLNLPWVAALEKVLVPSLSIKKDFSKFLRPNVIEIVGLPSIELWRTKVSQMNARDILKKIDLMKTFPIVLFFGSKDEGYENIFRTFVQDSLELKELTLLFAPLPQTKGELEKKIIAETNASHIQMVPAPVSLEEAAMVADLIITYRSDLGVQAVFLNKPVIYLDTKTSNYSNLALQNRWADRITSADEFVPVVRSKLQDRIYKADADIFQTLEIPKEGASLLGQMIESRVLD